MSGEAKARGKGKKGGYRGKKGSHTEEEEVSNGIGNGHGKRNLLQFYISVFVLNKYLYLYICNFRFF